MSDSVLGDFKGDLNGLLNESLVAGRLRSISCIDALVRASRTSHCFCGTGISSSAPTASLTFASLFPPFLPPGARPGITAATTFVLSPNTISSSSPQFVRRMNGYDAVLIIGIYCAFLSWAVLQVKVWSDTECILKQQERIATTPYGQDNRIFRASVVLNTCQSVAASLTAYAYIRMFGNKQISQQKRLSLREIYPTTKLFSQYMVIAVSASLAAPFGYASLRYLDYPTMILGKSSKIAECHGCASHPLSGFFPADKVSGCLYGNCWGGAVHSRATFVLHQELIPHQRLCMDCCCSSLTCSWTGSRILRKTSCSSRIQA